MTEKTARSQPHLTVEQVRRRFAETVRTLGAVRTASLVRALATVPREHFVGPGLWQILRPDRLHRGYETTADDDPRRLYDAVLVALDADRQLNNGEPISLLRWLDCLDLRPGDHVLHVGCGVGYYTAIAAEAVLPAGRVVGVEIDPSLAARAALCLRTYPNVEVVEAESSAWQARSFDAIFINAGATEIEPSWLDQLHLGGRLLVPLTVASNARTGVGFGQMLLVTRPSGRYAARFVSPVGIFHCAGARTDGGNEGLKASYARGHSDAVQSLRRDAHDSNNDCWLHRETFCLSLAPVEAETR